MRRREQNVKANHARAHVKEMKDMLQLERLIPRAKHWLLNYLDDNGESTRKELEPYVLSRINIKEKRDWTIEHVTKPIHSVAFILAYKELEAEGQIRIRRGDIPFPMTDFETIFVPKPIHPAAQVAITVYDPILESNSKSEETGPTYAYTAPDGKQFQSYKDYLVYVQQGGR